MNKEYYHDSGFSTILNDQSRDKLQAQLEGHKCKQCGEQLIIYTSVEGSCVVCGTDIYKHKPGIEIDIDFPRNNLPPKLIFDKNIW